MIQVLICVELVSIWELIVKLLHLKTYTKANKDGMLNDNDIN